MRLILLSLVAIAVLTVSIGTVYAADGEIKSQKDKKIENLEKKIEKLEDMIANLEAKKDGTNDQKTDKKIAKLEKKIAKLEKKLKKLGSVDDGQTQKSVKEFGSAGNKTQAFSMNFDNSTYSPGDIVKITGTIPYTMRDGLAETTITLNGTVVETVHKAQMGIVVSAIAVHGDNEEFDDYLERWWWSAGAGFGGSLYHYHNEFIKHANGEKLTMDGNGFSGNLKQNGSFDFKFAIPESTPPGSYKINMLYFFANYLEYENDYGETFKFVDDRDEKTKTFIVQ